MWIRRDPPRQGRPRPPVLFAVEFRTDKKKAVTVAIRLGGESTRAREKLGNDIRRAVRGEKAVVEKAVKEGERLYRALLARMGEGTFGFRTIWVHPREQAADDVRFLLELILLQEQMIDGNGEATRHAVGYIVDYIRDRLPWPVEEHRKVVAASVLHGLLKRFKNPQDYRAIWAYMKPLIKAALADLPKTTRNRKDEKEEDGNSVIAEDIEQAFDSENTFDAMREKSLCQIDRPALSPHWQSDHISVREAATQLEVSRDGIYAWRASGKLVLQGRRGHLWLDQKGVEQAERLRDERVFRRAIRLHFRRGGKTAEAAKKHIQRQLAERRTLAQIAQELPRRGFA